MDHVHQIEALKRRRTMDKNGKIMRWSDKMSPEAQLAMQLAIEDTKALKLEEEERLRNEAESRITRNGSQKSPTRVAFADEKKEKVSQDVMNDKNTDVVENKEDDVDKSSEPSFTELYERSNSARMRQDLTDEEYNEDAEPKKALGGGKVESAMEIVEIVNHDNPPSDEQAIEELARINSVDKCTVWIEATQAHQQDEPASTIPESGQETTPESGQGTTPESGQETIPENDKETTPENEQETTPVDK